MATSIPEALAIAIQHHQAGRLPAAEQIYRQILSVQPNHADAMHLLGVLAGQVGNHELAVAQIQQAIVLKPIAPDFHMNLGEAYRAWGKFAKAAGCYRRAIQLKPNLAEAYNNLGHALVSQGELAEAANCFYKTIQLQPSNADAHNDLGNILKAQGNLNEAIGCYHRALALAPEFAEAFHNLGNALEEQGEWEEALRFYRRAIEVKPDSTITLACLTHTQQHICSWEELPARSRKLIQLVDQDSSGGVSSLVPPFIFLTLPSITTAEQQCRCARRWVEQQSQFKFDPSTALTRPNPRIPNSKITIGYLSGDFRVHAVAWLFAELVEKHDRSRFQLRGYSYGTDDGSHIRQRIAKSFDHFADVRNESLINISQRIAHDKVDILVDLSGHTAETRSAILSHRPAPVQVNYLGYPGTMGASFMDYILVDAFVAPPEQQPFFAERLVHLPNCYQVNDSQREIAVRTPSRAECGLPEEGFVFCSFNNNYKITAEMFDVWMELLKAIPGSVLWLLDGNRFVVPNLRREAIRRGVAEERLVFAPRMTLPEHLARHRLADLFLDTFPVNAHTTASDALWAGCPVLTMAGETFISRVAGSLLTTIGLPELITYSLADYQALALRLARDEELLGGLRARLAANRTTSPLFNAELFARNLERAYQTMWDIYMAGEQPRAFAIE